jgi:hypothetical protein
MRAYSLSGTPTFMEMKSIDSKILIDWKSPSDTGAGEIATNPSDVAFYTVQISEFFNFSHVQQTINVSSSSYSAISYDFVNNIQVQFFRYTVILGDVIRGTQYFCRVYPITRAGTGNSSQIAGPTKVFGLSLPPAIISSTSGPSSQQSLSLFVTWRIPDDTGDLTNKNVLVD